MSAESAKSLAALLHPTVKSATLHCPIHGEYAGELRRYLSQEFPSGCPHCAVERAEKERREAEARAEAEHHRARARCYQSAGLPLRFWERDFEGYRARTAEQRKALATVRCYAEHFATVAERGICLLLCGGAGTGKTHLAVALAKALLDEGYTVRFAGVRAILREIRDAWRPDAPDREGDVVDRLVGHDLLIVDEVGMQFGSETEKLLLFDVLNGRYENLKPTVLISNLPVEALPDYLDLRLMDRLRENGGVVVPFTWASERGLKVAA